MCRQLATVNSQILLAIQKSWIVSLGSKISYALYTHA